jgi:hypothetical protein
MNRTHPPADTDLRVFRDPASVAVVGATAGQARPTARAKAAAVFLPPRLVGSRIMPPASREGSG